MSQLISLAELKNFLSISMSNVTEDGRLSNIAIQVSSLISSYCGRVFEANNYTEYFDGGYSAVHIANPPINIVNEVSQYTGSAYELLGSPDTSGQPIIIEGFSHSISKVGNPILKTRTKKLGRASARFDGASYLVTDNSEDWDLGVDDFTIECYARFDNTQVGAQTVASSGNASHNWSFGIDFSQNGMFFKVIEDSVEVCNVVQGSNTGYQANEFYHVAVSKDGPTVYLARNGNILANSNTFVSIPNYGTGINIAKYMTGYLDNLRIDHAANYTVPYNNPQYSLPPNNNTKLLLHFDGDNNSSNFTDDSRKVNDYLYYPDTGEITFDSGEGGGRQDLSFFRPLKLSNYANGVKVSYNGGYVQIPEDLKLAAMEMAKLIYKGKTGTETMSFQGESLKSFTVSVDEFPPQVRRILNLYRLIK